MVSLPWCPTVHASPGPRDSRRAHTKCCLCGHLERCPAQAVASLRVPPFLRECSVCSEAPLGQAHPRSTWLCIDASRFFYVASSPQQPPVHPRWPNPPCARSPAQSLARGLLSPTHHFALIFFPFMMHALHILLPVHVARDMQCALQAQQQGCHPVLRIAGSTPSPSPLRSTDVPQEPRLLPTSGLTPTLTLTLSLKHTMPHSNRTRATPICHTHMPRSYATLMPRPQCTLFFPTSAVHSLPNRCRIGPLSAPVRCCGTSLRAPVR